MILTSAVNLQAHMDHRKVSQADLAKYVGCSRQFINKLLKGDAKGCTPQLARDIEKILNVPDGAIFTPKESIEKVRTVNAHRRPVMA
ncbi:helix-turn-helix transcriptional regulator [Paeniglutamicibacter sp.]|uniref:helix-turn-helix transcriptional regulator n=1 Tax=Paeniglutamicibacter sp. TaxID=1934391 RepID=UPI003988CE3E